MPGSTSLHNIDVDRFDLTNPPLDFPANPFPYYQALRERAPVHLSDNGNVLLTRYADVLTVYRDSTHFSSDKNREFKPKFGNTPLFDHHTTSLVFNDPPLHTRVRRAIMGALAPRVVTALEPDLRALVDKLIQRALRMGHFDGIDDFAACIPVEVIGNLLRIPDEEREPLRNWSLAILSALEPRPTDEQLSAGNAAVSEFLDYLERVVAHRKKHLSNDRGDLLSRLIKGSPKEQPLSHSELLHNCIFILNAGHETTTNLIGNGIALLLEHPQAANALRQSPKQLTLAIEEMLRFQSPNQLGNRLCIADVRIGDVQLRAGTAVTLCIGAANRDPEIFSNPESFDHLRQPNPHLAFANGIHLCAGLNVARLEARVAIEALLQSMPSLRLAGIPEWTGRVRFRGYKHLPLAVNAG